MHTNWRKEVSELEKKILNNFVHSNYSVDPMNCIGNLKNKFDSLSLLCKNYQYLK